MPRVFSTAELLGHLKRCDDCDYYVGAPMACSGQNDDSKKGFWYEKCLKNAQPTPDSCEFFTWRQDIARGKPTTGKKIPCPGVLCREASKPNASNAECTFGVCMRCCRHLQPLLTVVRSCSIKSHRKGVVYPTPDSNATSQDDPKPVRQGRGRPKGNKAGKEKVTGAESDALPGTPTRAPPKTKSYATPTGPFYQARLSALDAEHRLEVERHAERAKQDRAQTFRHTIMVRWWRMDGAHAENAELDIDNPSSFHPKDIPHLVDLYQCDTQRFEYYNSKKAVWIIGSRFTAPRDANKLSGDDLCYRSEGVTWGPGMPGQYKKRPLPDENVNDNTPRRPAPPFAQFPNTPASTPRHMHSPAPTEPPMSGSSAFTDEPDTDPFFNAFDFTPTFLDKGAHTYTEINDTEPRLPALFASDIDMMPSYPSTSTTATPCETVQLDLSTAPRGRGANGWPWRYVCDMAAGFDAVRCLEDGIPRMETRDAFEEVFRAEYKKTTYREQLVAWRAAGHVTGERERWIRLGRAEGGSPFPDTNLGNLLALLELTRVGANPMDSPLPWAWEAWRERVRSDYAPWQTHATRDDTHMLDHARDYSRVFVTAYHASGPNLEDRVRFATNVSDAEGQVYKGREWLTVWWRTQRYGDLMNLDDTINDILTEAGILKSVRSVVDLDIGILSGNPHPVVALGRGLFGEDAWGSGPAHHPAVLRWLRHTLDMTRLDWIVVHNDHHGRVDRMRAMVYTMCKGPRCLPGVISSYISKLTYLVETMDFHRASGRMEQVTHYRKILYNIEDSMGRWGAPESVSMLPPQMVRVLGRLPSLAYRRMIKSDVAKCQKMLDIRGQRAPDFPVDVYEVLSRSDVAFLAGAIGGDDGANPEDWAYESHDEETEAGLAFARITLPRVW